jgi:hypothetical protein
VYRRRSPSVADDIREENRAVPLEDLHQQVRRGAVRGFGSRTTTSGKITCAASTRVRLLIPTSREVETR